MQNEPAYKTRLAAQRAAKKAGEGFTVAETNGGFSIVGPERPAEPPAKDAEQYDKLVKHQGKVLQIGFGSVGQAMLPMVLRHIETDPSGITVLEKDDSTELFNERFGDTGVSYVIKEILRDNLDEVLSQYLSEGDLLINLALNIDGVEIVTWCLEHGVLYVDTSIEVWADEPDEAISDLAKRTLWESHRRIREATKQWHGQGATCVVTHGANPGLVSHFTKAALLDIAKAMDIDAKVPETREGWAELMKATGTKVIHIAERDTQVVNRPKLPGEFVNTWSCEGFWAEGRAPAEMGWGTHEAQRPKGGDVQKGGGAAYLKAPGVDVQVKSWVPLGGCFNGFLVQHSEAITISEYFATADYRPTVHYAYCPTDMAIASVHEFRGHELEMQDAQRIAKDEVIAGIDELGVLLLGHGKNAWWYGSQLGIDEARRLIPHENATSLQVVASLLGALVWMLRNPDRGYLEPEDLPFDEVLRVARPYLGPIASVQSDWKPTEDRSTLFRKPLDEKNPWSFENFRV
jgi:homospermidine synthase